MQVSQREPQERTADGSEITVMSYDLNWKNIRM